MIAALYKFVAVDANCFCLYFFLFSIRLIPTSLETVVSVRLSSILQVGNKDFRFDSCSTGVICML